MKQLINEINVLLLKDFLMKTAFLLFNSHVYFNKTIH